MTVLLSGVIRVESVDPTVTTLPGGRIHVSIDDAALSFNDAGQLGEWLGAACEGLSALLEPDPCGGGQQPDRGGEVGL